MAVQTTATTANRSHAVAGLNGFVSMRTSVAYRRGRFGCRIGANQVVGLLTGEASGFFGSGVTWWIRAFFVHGPDVPALGTAVHTLGSSRPWSWLGTRTNEVFRLLFARGLRLRRKWRDVVDQVRVVLVHAPDVSARTAIVRDDSVLARERQMFGGILPTRRTGRNWHVGNSSFPARNVPAEPQLFPPSFWASGPLVTPKSWEAIPFVSLGMGWDQKSRPIALGPRSGSTQHFAK